MDKSFVAIYGVQNSSVVTYDEAVEWAANILANGGKATSPVYLCRVETVVKRKVPEITIDAFRPHVPASKAA
jgi:hypothetical protein